MNLRVKKTAVPAITVPGAFTSLLMLSGCFVTPESLKTSSATDGSANSKSPSSASSTSPVTTAADSSTSVPSGARAAKIIFRQSSSSGSFDSAPSTGTINAPGSGHQAKRVFNADGSLLASGGPTASTWPKWLSGVEIGISGASNTGAKNTDCARFTVSNESSSTKCGYDSNGDGDLDDDGDGSLDHTSDCGAPDGYFRVSEFDCVKSSDSVNGNGGPTDGVYIRASFSRDTSNLGTTENILAVLEYSANFLNGAAPDPTTCFSSGTFNPSRAGCSDQLWQIFIKHTSYEVVQPYMILAPGATHTVDRVNGHFGGNPGSKQFIIPLSGDSNLSVLQLSRIKGPEFTSGNTFNLFCGNNGDDSDKADSAGCVGMVFHSLTFIRM